MTTTLTPADLTMTTTLNSDSKTCGDSDDNGKGDGCFEGGSVYTKIHVSTLNATPTSELIQSHILLLERERDSDTYKQKVSRERKLDLKRERERGHMCSIWSLQYSAISPLLKCLRSSYCPLPTFSGTFFY
ncbi:hypothetical protein QVD17_26168 [Tagetes erecta]|uniref:Uncharacterized protein n=1 Tax=Tagetes erecta TaxID=13708 RepID=A0AAD8NQJ9_TARER|nr:hypothetical protein QVD17_26168 [Tagetes erecta]